MTDFVQPQDSEAVVPLREQMEAALDRGDHAALLALIRDEHPGNVADALEYIDFDRMTAIFKALQERDASIAAAVLIELDEAVISELYPRLTLQQWSQIVHELSDDDVVHILELFPEEAQQRLVAKMTVQDKEDVLELMTYPENTAGRIMTNEFLAIDGDETVASATEKVRNQKDLDPMNLFFVFVTEHDRLVGMVSLRRLLINQPETKIKGLMRTDVISVDVNMDQEEVAEIVTKHDEITVPVVDDENRILGIITVDDVIDVINEESDEDIYKLVGSSEKELLAGDRTFRIVRLRLPWILASFLGSLLVASLMKFTEDDVFGSMAGKIFIFVPMICAMGGNVGVQSATIMARLLSSTHIDWNEARRSTFKEARVGLTLGLVCGGLIGGIAWIWGGPVMLITVMASMICAMTTAAITGTVIPIGMKRLGFDPALATGPFVTSFNDVVATCVYFLTVFVFFDKLVI